MASIWQTFLKIFLVLFIFFSSVTQIRTGSYESEQQLPLEEELFFLEITCLLHSHSVLAFTLLTFKQNYAS